MSPQITIPKSQITAYEQKRGIYTKLKEPLEKVIKTRKEQKKFTGVLAISIKEAFIKYARAHSCPENKLELEWNRFYKFLKERL